MMSQEDFLSQVGNFTGTEHYYKASIFGNIVLTDGVQFLREKLRCYWLIDIIVSVQHKPKIQENKSFIVWKIEVKNRAFVVSAFSDYDESLSREENKKYLLYEQKGNYTDFPLTKFEFYQEGEVLLLKSEH